MKKILSVALALIMVISCTLVVFAEGTYTVTATVDGTGGKFIDATGKTAFVPLTTTASDSAVPEGSEKIYVIAPDAGYRVKSVKVNGQEAALDHLTLKLSNISGNKDIVIQFETGTKTDQTVVNETFDTGIDNFTSTGTGNISWDEAGKALKVSGASTNFRLIYSPGMEVKTGHKYTITFDITPSITQQNCGAFGIDAGDKGYTFDTLRSSNATNILYNYTSVGTFNNSYTANTKTTFTYDFTVFGIKNNGVQVDSVDTKTIGANVLFINMIKTAGITGFEATIDNFKIVDTSVTAGPPADPTLSISVDGGNGTVKDSGAVVSGDVTVPYGGSKTLTFVPDNGYLIDKVLVNGAPVTLDSKNEYTLTNITENQNIVVTFRVPMPPSISSGGAVFVQVDYIDGSDPTLYNSAVIFSTVVLPEGWELTGDYGILFTGGTVTDYKLLSVANIAGKFGIRVFGKGLVPGSYSVKAYAVVKNTISGETMTVYEPEPRSFTIT